MKQEKTRLEVPMETLSPVMTACLERGQDVALGITGNSMSPFLRDRRDTVVLRRTEPESLMPGDVPFYQRANGHMVLHRIIEKDDGEHRWLYGKKEPLPSEHPGEGITYTMMGDAQLVPEPGIRPQQIVAVAVAFIRRGKRWDCAGRRYRFNRLLWHKVRRRRYRLMWLIDLPGRAWRHLPFGKK